MNEYAPKPGWLLLFVLACAGAMLAALPPWVVGQIETVARFGEFWVYVYLVVVGSGALLLIGVSAWTLLRLWQHGRAKQAMRTQQGRNPSQLTPAETQREIDANLAAVEQLQRDTQQAPELRAEIEPLVDRLEEKRASERLEIVAFGTVSSGKSALLNALLGREQFRTDLRGGTTIERNAVDWQGRDRVVLVDTPGLGEIDGAEHVAAAAAAARDADVVLLVVDGPLRQSEFRLLEQLAEMEKRIVVCLNKVDWYAESDRDKLLGQLRDQTNRFTAASNVVAVRSGEAQRRRIRVAADGREVEETDTVGPDIVPLADRLLAIVDREGPRLLLANLLLQSRGLVEEARQRARAALDRQAWSIVDRYMWGAGGAAALSPFPVVDIVAGCAISTKMVVDLARVYRQDIDLDAAVRLLGELGKNLLAMLGAGVATPAVASVVASLLKTVPGAGTVAGGVLQGVVQALVTRWIGGVFIAYFRQEMQTPMASLAGEARRHWQQLTTVAELRRLLDEARRRWGE